MFGIKYVSVCELSMCSPNVTMILCLHVILLLIGGALTNFSFLAGAKKWPLGLK